MFYEASDIRRTRTRCFPSEVQTLLPSLTPKEASTAAAIVGGIGLLVRSTAEAQLPDFEIYGIDTTWVHEYVGGQWHETDTAVNNVYYPGGSTEGVASYRYADPNYDCSPLSVDGLFTKESVKRTYWYSDGTHLNGADYREYCVLGKIRRDDYLEAVPDLVLYLKSKARGVGVIQTKAEHYQFTHHHLTSVYFTAKHTSEEKNFTVIIKYRVEGSIEVTTVQMSYVLKPGQRKKESLSVPGGGSWSTIDSVTFHENRPPDPVPVFTPVPVPVPAPPPPAPPVYRSPRR